MNILDGNRIKFVWPCTNGVIGGVCKIRVRSDPCTYTGRTWMPPISHGAKTLAGFSKGRREFVNVKRGKSRQGNGRGRRSRLKTLENHRSALWVHEIWGSRSLGMVFGSFVIAETLVL